ncbi:MAG: 8-oxo-dGTP diphosphatase / 2-hydroxy-dATP diphosphatase [Parcubacteria bacterium C7867-008]|nr:MAG: 8-oxo-dGTP diphosphatase / 2-hydroxy-dATP diphosphatase [Parcubacteria bacterium C7867-008]
MKVATLAIIVKDGKVLLGEKKKGEIGTGTLNGPGGKLDPGESVLECLIRETDEELGIELFPEYLKKVAIITFFAAGEPDFQVHVYRTDTFEGELVETADMIPNWYDIEDIPYDRMLGSDHMWFARAISGEPFNANVYYRERTKDFINIDFLPFEDCNPRIDV